MRSLLIIAILFSLTAQSAAQERTASIRGTVIDAGTGDGLEGVHVFVAGTLTGSVTRTDGTYTLTRVPAGAVRLMFSMIGYRTVTVDTVLQRNTVQEIDARLAPRVIELDEVAVSGERPRRWASRLRQFERLFIGESALAQKSDLLNAEVLDFKGGIGRLRASAAEPLVIENRGLGYRLTYHLREFERSGGTVRWDGDPFFEELEPSGDTERSSWPIARCETFFGSFRHLVLSLIEGDAWAEGFRIGTRLSLDPMHRSAPFRVRESRIVQDGPSQEERELRWAGYLEVEYVRKLESDEYLRWERRGIHARPTTQRSWIRVSRRPAIVDLDGEVLDPYALTLYGYFAFTRIGDLLPKEYRPPSWVMHPRDCQSILLATR